MYKYEVHPTQSGRPSPTSVPACAASFSGISAGQLPVVNIQQSHNIRRAGFKMATDGGRSGRSMNKGRLNKALVN